MLSRTDRRPSVHIHKLHRIRVPTIMTWLWRFRSWLRAQEERKKSRDSQERADSKRPSSERRRSWPRARDSRAHQNGVTTSTNPSASRWTGKQTNGDIANSVKHADVKPLETYGHRLWPHKKHIKTTEGRVPVSTNDSQNSNDPNEKRASRQPIYTHPKRAAISFLRTTKQSSSQRLPGSRPSSYSRSVVSRRSSGFVPLSQLAEESESKEVSQTREGDRAPSRIASVPPRVTE